MGAPRLFWLLSGAGIALFMFSLSMQTGTQSSVLIREESSFRPAAQVRRAAAAPIEIDEATPHSHDAASVAVANSAPPALGANFSAPAKPLSSVAAASQRNNLARACTIGMDPTAAAKKRELLHLVPAAAEGGKPGCLHKSPICDALRHALTGGPTDGASASRRGAGRKHQMIVTSAVSGQREEVEAFTEAAAALRLRTLVLAMDADAFAAAGRTTAAAVLLDGSVPPLARKWAALAEVLEAGVEVLWVDVDGVLASAPFELLHADSDFAGMSEGWEDIFLRGHVMGADDPSMGWSRYCESMRAALLVPSLFHLLPTHPSVALSRRLAAAAQARSWPSAAGAAWSADASEAIAMSTELLMPAHDDTTRVGAKARVLHQDCWLNDRKATTTLGSNSPRPAALMPGRGISSGGGFFGGMTGGGGAEGGGGGAPGLTDQRCRQRSAIALFHKGESLSRCWSLGLSRLPPVWTMERTRVDPLMGHKVLMERTKK